MSPHEGLLFGMGALTYVKNVKSFSQRPWADEAIAGNDKAVADYKSGNGASINALMGYGMKASRGKANPPAVIAMLKQKLGG